jgi:hypothetical protein
VVEGDNSAVINSLKPASAFWCAHALNLTAPSAAAAAAAAAVAGDNPENDAARIEQLLRLGAHALLGEEPAPTTAAAGEGEGGAEGAAPASGFAAEGIDEVGWGGVMVPLLFVSWP